MLWTFNFSLMYYLYLSRYYSLKNYCPISQNKWVRLYRGFFQPLEGLFVRTPLPLRKICTNVLSFQVTEKVSPNGVPDIFWIVVPGLHPLADKYGPESKPVHEAKRLLADVLVQITDVFEEIYSGKVICSSHHLFLFSALFLNLVTLASFSGLKAPI